MRSFSKSFSWIVLLATAIACSSEAEKDNSNDTGTSDSDTASEADTGEAAPVEEEEEEEEEADPAIEQVLNYTGDLTIEIETQWGIDQCQGSLNLSIDTDKAVVGDGDCQFIILGAQTPLFSGISTNQGAANGAVLLSAFGNDLLLDWEGQWSDNTFGCDHSGESTIAPIGDFTYSIQFELSPQEF